MFLFPPSPARIAGAETGTGARLTGSRLGVEDSSLWRRTPKGRASMTAVLLNPPAHRNIPSVASAINKWVRWRNRYGGAYVTAGARHEGRATYAPESGGLDQWRSQGGHWFSERLRPGLSLARARIQWRPCPTGRGRAARAPRYQQRYTRIAGLSVALRRLRGIALLPGGEALSGPGTESTPGQATSRCRRGIP